MKSTSNKLRYLAVPPLTNFPITVYWIYASQPFGLLDILLGLNPPIGF